MKFFKIYYEVFPIISYYVRIRPQSPYSERSYFATKFLLSTFLWCKKKFLLEFIRIYWTQKYQPISMLRVLNARVLIVRNLCVGFSKQIISPVQKTKRKKNIFFSKISRKFHRENSVAKNSLLVFEEIPRVSVKFVRSTSFSKIILNFAPPTANHVQTDSIAKSDVSFEYFNRSLYFGNLLFPQCL